MSEDLVGFLVLTFKSELVFSVQECELQPRESCVDEEQAPHSDYKVVSHSGYKAGMDLLPLIVLHYTQNSSVNYLPREGLLRPPPFILLYTLGAVNLRGKKWLESYRVSLYPSLSPDTTFRFPSFVHMVHLFQVVQLLTCYCRTKAHSCIFYGFKECL